MPELPTLLSQGEIPTREARVSASSGSEVIVAAELGSGHKSILQLDVAEVLLIPLRPHRAESGNISWNFHDRAWLKPYPNGNMPYLPETVEFLAETAKNLLRPTVWFKLFPSDVRLAGAALWKHLVEEGALAKDQPVTAIDVVTQQFSVFDDVSKAVEWAKEFRRPTVYFHMFGSRFRHIVKGTF